MDTRWNSTTKYIVGIGLFLTLLIVLYISRPILGMAAAALILAFLTYPIVRFLHDKARFPRGLAAITSYLILGLVLALIPLIITPIAIDAFRAINFDAFLDWFQDQLAHFESRLLAIRNVQIFAFQISLATLVDPVLEFLAGSSPQEFASLEDLLALIPTAFTSVTSVAGYLATTISSAALAFFLTLIIAIYISIDARRFYNGLLSLAPDAYRHEYRMLIRKIANVWSSFFRGQLTVSLILALITWIGATAIGLPGAFILGLTAGFLALIPSLGPILSLIPAFIVALVQGSTYLPVGNFTFALIVMGLYVLIQQLEGNLITPRIVGQAIDLPPVIVLMGVVIGTTTAGLLGAVLAAPIIATGRIIFTYIWNKLLDRKPFLYLEPKIVEPVQLSTLAETVSATQQQLQDRVQQISSLIQSISSDEEE